MSSWIPDRERWARLGAPDNRTKGHGENERISKTRKATSIKNQSVVRILDNCTQKEFCARSNVAHEKALVPGGDTRASKGSMLKNQGAEVEQPHRGTRFFSSLGVCGLPVRSSLGARSRVELG